MNKLLGAILSLMVLISCSPATTSQVQNTDNGGFNADGSCPDLVMEKIEVIKTSKNKATVLYTIKNIGSAPANILGESRKEYDNVAIKMFFSADEKMNRGDILIDGEYIGDYTLAEGKLYPSESFTGEVKISLKAKSSYTPYIVINLDALETLTECDETNNISSQVI